MFDGLAFNANLVEGTPGASFALVHRLGKYAPFPFIIDPMTHAFALPPHYLHSEQMNRQTGEPVRRLRRTFAGLSVQYGEPFAGQAGAHELTPESFRDPGMIRAVTEAVVEYQETTLQSQASDDVTDVDIPPAQPLALIPPYFCVTSVEKEGWLPINQLFVETALRERSDYSVFAVICLDRKLLQEEASLESIIEAYANLDCDGYFVWVSNLPEIEAGSYEVRALLKLTKRLQSRGQDVFGYFSGILGLALGFTGVVHAVGYGERRDVVPVLGGGACPSSLLLSPFEVVLAVFRGL